MSQRGKELEALIARVLAAHGGSRWQSIDSMSAVVSAQGLLFRAKHRPAMRRQRVRIAMREPHVWLDDFPRPGLVGELRPDGSVLISGGGGRILAERRNPRERLLNATVRGPWDDLDFLYFAGYTTWNYLTAPFLYFGGRCATELSSVREGNEWWLRFSVRFPSDLPTHSPEQLVYVDPTGRLARLDYTAEVVGPWAHAAQMCRQHRWFDGVLIPTRRVVTPRTLGWAWPAPTLVDVSVHDVSELRLKRDRHASTAERSLPR